MNDVHCERSFFCNEDDCSYVFKTQAHLDRHTLSKHSFIWKPFPNIELPKRNESTLTNLLTLDNSINSPTEEIKLNSDSDEESETDEQNDKLFLKNINSVVSHYIIVFAIVHKTTKIKYTILKLGQSST